MLLLTSYTCCNYSDNYTVNRHSGTNPKVLDIKTVRHYEIRPCEKTLLDAALRLVEFQIMIYKLVFLSRRAYIVSTVGR